VTTRVLRPDWMPLARPRRIIVHWTAGPHVSTAVDRQHYHVLIEALAPGVHIVRGARTIADNDSTSDGRYAAHTRLLNQGSIGVAVCGMAGATERPYSPGRRPITDAQWRALYAVLADLCERYGLAPVPASLCSHAEVERVHGVRQAGKWDISIDRAGRLVGPVAAGDEMRAAVRALMDRPPPAARPARALEGRGHD